MIARIFRAVWFLSLLAVTATLLYQYASFPQAVTLLEDQENTLTLSNEAVFYVALGCIAIINVLIFPVSFVSKDNTFKAWFFGLITTLNIFLIISLSFISLYNSGEKYEYTRLERIIQGSLGLILIWSLLWPALWSYRKISRKSTVADQVTSS